MHGFGAVNAPENRLAFSQGGGAPTQYHIAVAPMRDPARDGAHAAEQVFDRVRRAQGAGELVRQSQPGYGQAFLQSLAQCRSGARMGMLQLARLVLQQRLNTVHVARGVGLVEHLTQSVSEISCSEPYNDAQ